MGIPKKTSSILHLPSLSMGIYGYQKKHFTFSIFHLPSSIKAHTLQYTKKPGNKQINNPSLTVINKRQAFSLFLC